MAVHNALQAYESRKGEIINFEVGRGNGSFSVQAPFELVQGSIGLSVFHVTLDSNNRTSVTTQDARWKATATRCWNLPSV